MSNSVQPSMFENMIIQTSDVHSYPTKQADVHFAATKRTQRTVRHFGAKLWNTLCNVIQ